MLNLLSRSWLNIFGICLLWIYLEFRNLTLSRLLTRHICHILSKLLLINRRLLLLWILNCIILLELVLISHILRKILRNLHLLVWLNILQSISKRIRKRIIRQIHILLRVYSLLLINLLWIKLLLIWHIYRII